MISEPKAARETDPAVLLIGPYDPSGGEYTFLAPPLGVWRLAGVLRHAGYLAEVFDPNSCSADPALALERKLRERQWDVVGFSTTGMTLRFDLGLVHRSRRVSPQSMLVAGGMEATFKPQLMFELAPFDLVVLGEGERPLLAIGERLRGGSNLRGIPGTATRNPDGTLDRIPQPALSREELRDAIFRTPYEEMPYELYWSKLESAYRVRSLPFKADREARLAEIRSVRLITLNYCPMACTFCSSTNFLNAAQDSTARIARLDEHECVAMIERIVQARPSVRTVIFQDDIFVFPSDRRIVPLCEAIIEAKRNGSIPEGLQFISTNRIDAMTNERLVAMRRAGFRVCGFGIESFSLPILTEFNKAKIYPHIEPVLHAALSLGITPFLDLILTAPSCSIADLSRNIREAHRWIRQGCEVGMYPYVIPFSGAAMAEDPRFAAQTHFAKQRIDGTGIEWDQPAKILPFDSEAREAILEIEAAVAAQLDVLEREGTHLPSRVRSLIWILCAIPVLTRAGEDTPDVADVRADLRRQCPAFEAEAARC